MNWNERLSLFIFIAIALALRAMPLFLHGAFVDSESQQYISGIMQQLNGQVPSFGERLGSFYITTIPYLLTGSLLGLDGTIFLVHALLVILACLITYSLASRLTNDKRSGIIAVALLAVMPTAIESQSFANYVGDFFVSILGMASLWFLLTYLKNKRISFLALGCVIAYCASQMWNGGDIIFASLFAALGVIWLSDRADSRYVLSSALVLSLLGYYLIYPHLSLYVGPSLSNVNVHLESHAFALNILTLASQQNLLFGIRAYSFGIILAGIALYLFPLLLLVKKPTVDKEMLGVCALLLIALPVALTDARFESFVVLPMAILAGAGIKRIKMPHKLPIYTLLLVLMALLGILEVWSVVTYF